jgi:uncharacterized protein YbjT (DUF2867 family)
MKVISIFGGTGFIGTELINQLVKMPVKIIVFTRKKKKANHLKLLPKVTILEISSKNFLSDNLEGSDIIINLVGILHEHQNVKFSMAHEDFVTKLIKAALKQNIKRLIHLSALGVSKTSGSRYLYSKYKTELVIRNKFKSHDWTILRPSIVFGPNDKFINLFKIFVRFLPVIFLVSPKSEFQPIHVDDLVDIIIKTIADKKTYMKTYNLGGPKKFTLYEIVKLITKCDKKSNVVISLNKTMSYLFVRLLMLSPVKIITTDNLKSMETSNTVMKNDAYSFKRSLKALSTYLTNHKKINI